MFLGSYMRYLGVFIAYKFTWLQLIYLNINLDVNTLCMYNDGVTIIWDENKNKRNIQKHGLDFSDAVEVFSSAMLVRLDTRNEYGEDRWIGLGVLRNTVVVVVYTEDNRTNLIRIISMRKALKHEREYYNKRFKN